MIDENGKEILPLEYDNIWTFYGKQRVTTKVVKGNVAHNVILSELFGKDKPQEMVITLITMMPMPMIMVQTMVNTLARMPKMWKDIVTM